MNFFKYQDQARRATTRLVVLFVLAVLAIVLMVNVAAYPVLGNDLPKQALLSLTTVLVIGIASWWRIRALRGGGALIAAQMGATLVPADTADPLLRRYRNVAEEMAIAAGIPVPMLFVLDQEPGINAFAAGYSPSDAAVAITRGALQQLNRDELQGVIAHEYSHVLNGDMRLNIHLMGGLFGILMLGVIGRKLLGVANGSGLARRRGGIGPVAAVLVAGLVAIIIGAVGVFFARLIKAAVSRQREVLADASAVQFTRNNAGLAGALKKIAGLPAGSALHNRAGAEEVSHMLFGEGVAWSRWFATHPPMLQRIAWLEPGFTATHLKLQRQRWSQAAPDGLAEDRLLGLVDQAVAVPQDVPRQTVPLTSPLPPVAGPLTPQAVSAQVGNPGVDDYRQAHALHRDLPPALSQAARQRELAPALVLALLLDGSAPLRSRQQAMVAAQLGEATARSMLALWPLCAALHAGLRLPLAALAFPALRSNPRPHLRQVHDTIEQLIQVDGQHSLFEYCLAQLLRSQVVQALDPAAHVSFGARRLGQVQGEFSLLLSVLAQAGHPGQPVQARQAYAAGLQRVVAGPGMVYQVPADGARALDAVWPALDALEPLAKELVVESLVAVVTLDGRIRVAEAELLRTVCGVLHCPLPACLQAGN